MPYNLLLLPLLGGFLLLHLANSFRYRAQRLENYRLLFESAVAGTILLGLARLIVVLGSMTGARQWFSYWWGLISPFPNGDSAALALMLGPAIAWLINRRVSRLEARNRAVAKHGDLLMQLLSGANQGQSLISVTLANSKWYVGFVYSAPGLDPLERYFQLVPIMSGYRRKETLETVPVVFYDEALRSTNASALAITLPLADIKIANLFDVDQYYNFFADQTDNRESA